MHLTDETKRQTKSLAQPTKTFAKRRRASLAQTLNHVGGPVGVCWKKSPKRQRFHDGLAEGERLGSNILHRNGGFPVFCGVRSGLQGDRVGQFRLARSSPPYRFRCYPQLPGPEEQKIRLFRACPEPLALQQVEHFLLDAMDATAGGKAGDTSSMDRIDPAHRFRLLYRIDVEVDDHSLVVGAHHKAFERLLG